MWVRNIAAYLTALHMIGCTGSIQTASTEARLCSELRNLDREILDRHLNVEVRPIAETDSALAQCFDATSNLAFVDGYLQGLDRAAAIVSAGPLSLPSLAEPAVGASVGVRSACMEGEWETVEERLASIRREVRHRIDVHLAACP